MSYRIYLFTSNELYTVTNNMHRSKKCHCRGPSQCGGAKAHKNGANKVKIEYTTLPVRQQGGDFLGIGSWAKRVVKNPLRLAAAVGTFGMSEAAIKSGQAFKSVTGVKPSKVLDVGAPIAAFAGMPEVGIPAKAVSFGYKQIGLGKKKRAPHRKKRKKRKK